jgi:hypothetical protein
MGRCSIWAGAVYGPLQYMGRCSIWAGAVYRPLQYMGRCSIWTGAVYGPLQYMGRAVYGPLHSHFSVRVLLIFEDPTVIEMQTSNKSVVPLLEFVSKCNVE